jgi:hypothetical protein
VEQQLARFNDHTFHHQSYPCPNMQRNADGGRTAWSKEVKEFPFLDETSFLALAAQGMATKEMRKNKAVAIGATVCRKTHR